MYIAKVVDIHIYCCVAVELELRLYAWSSAELEWRVHELLLFWLEMREIPGAVLKTSGECMSCCHSGLELCEIPGPARKSSGECTSLGRSCVI
jgi:hypothetical protein